MKGALELNASSSAAKSESKISDTTCRCFAEDTDYNPRWLTYGLDFILDRLRTKCFKHQKTRTTTSYDLEQGANSEAITPKDAPRGWKPPDGWFACGCSHESHVLDLLALKVSVLAANNVLCLTKVMMA
jgi:hypothetical protein